MLQATRRMLRRFAGGAGAAITAQMVAAGGSFLLQVLAARSLGDAGYGRFAVCLAVIITVTALQTGWLGDSLTVLDRHAPEVRAALATSLIASGLLGLIGGLLVGVLIGLDGWLAPMLFGTLLATWLLEESGRRLLMARLEFWKLVGNDMTYLAVGLAVLFCCRAAGLELTLGVFLGAMTAGAAAAVLLVLVQVPRTELSELRPGLTGMRAVAGFAAWRSAQATLRPAALLAARLLVLHLVSAAAVGRLELARLLMAPAQTVINGAGAFLLPTFTRTERERPGTRAGRRRQDRRADRAVLALAAATVLSGLIVLGVLGPLGRLISGGRFDVSPIAVLGWTVYLSTWAATLPYVSETVARRLSREVFRARLVDSVVGVALTVAVLAVDHDLVALVPWALAVGGTIGALKLRRLAARTRQSDPRPAQDLWGTYAT
jgi:O-antigen/teichoic acid export membrane protein